MTITNTANQHCEWMTEKGKTCHNKHLMPGSKFCSTHYWMALWQFHQLEDVPRPTKTQWRLLIPYLLSVIVFLVFAYKAGFITIGDWIQEVKYMATTPMLFWPSYQIRMVLRMFFAGLGYIASMFWVFTINPFWPMKPRSRRAIVLVSTISAIIGIVGLVYVYMALYPWQNTGELGADLVLIRRFFLFTIIPVLADIVLFSIGLFRPQIATTRKFFYIYRIVMAITFVVTLANIYVMWLTSEKNVTLALLAFGAGIGSIASGFKIIYRSSILGYDWWLRFIAYITDAFQPLPPGYFGDVNVAPEDRQRALELALRNFSRLTPLEQSELTEYLVTKHTPSIWQRLFGLILVILSAFLIEAPMSYLWSWLCGQVHWGPPFCP